MSHLNFTPILRPARTAAWGGFRALYGLISEDRLGRSDGLFPPPTLVLPGAPSCGALACHRGVPLPDCSRDVRLARWVHSVTVSHLRSLPEGGGSTLFVPVTCLVYPSLLCLLCLSSRPLGSVLTVLHSLEYSAVSRVVLPGTSPTFRRLSTPQPRYSS